MLRHQVEIGIDGFHEYLHTCDEIITGPEKRPLG